MMTLLSRSFLALRRRASRNILTILAVVLSAATLAALLGITASSASQTARRFSQMETPTLQVDVQTDAWNLSDAEVGARLADFEYIEAVGTLSLPQDSSFSVTVAAPRWGTSIDTTIGVATTEGLAAREARIVAGTTAAHWPASAADPYTVMLGARLASELGITMQQNHPFVTLNGISLAVTGIVKDAPSQAALATAAILSPETAALLGIRPLNRTLLVRVEENTAAAVGANLAAALNPTSPESVSIKYPSDPTKLRNSLLADSQNLTFITTAIMVAVSTFSIINTMQIAIVERRKEIGIDMALGLGRVQIALQFLVESMLLGIIGAMVGTLLGAVIVGAAALIGQWPFMIPAYVALIPLFGLAVGALAGVIPAVRAGRINPAELLRSI